MDDMREIVTKEQMDHLFILLALALPVLGLAVGAALGGRRGSLRTGAIKGLLIGLVGPLNLLLWTVYNAITDRMGLDSVANLLVNLALMVALGVAAGLGFGYASRRGILPWRPGSEGGPATSVPAPPLPVPATPGNAKRPEDAA